MKRLILFVAFFAGAFTGNAQNPKFTSVSPSGHTLSYEIYQAGHAWVTCEASHYSVHYSGAVAYSNLSGAVVVPDSVVYNGATYPVDAIGNRAFCRCQNISSITLPSTITFLDWNSFEYSDVDTIISLSYTAPELRPDAFLNANTNPIVIVPCSSQQNYIDEWGSSFIIQCPFQIQFNLIITPNDTTWGTGSYLALSDSIVEITATANYGYHFDHWSYGSTANPDTIVLTEDASITAFFAKNLYTLNVNENNDSFGSVALPLGNMAYYLDTLTAIAHPNTHYHFKKWKTVGSVSEDVDYSNLSLSDFTQMSADTTNPAGGNTFRYVVTTSITNTTNWFCYYWFESLDGSMEWQFTPRCSGIDAMGFGHDVLQCCYYDLFTNTIIGNTITYSNLGNVKVTYSNIGWVIEFPVEVRCAHRQTNASYTTVYWGTGEMVLAETDTVDIVMDKDNDILCVFAPDTHYVSVLTSDPLRGSVVSSITSGAYGEQYTIQATSNYGYHFSAWSDGDTNNPRNMTITQDTVLIAYFVKNQYFVAGIANDSIRGFVSGNAIVDYLDTVDLTAVANYGYHFQRWSDYSTDNPKRIVATSNITKTAFFNINQYSITVQSDTIAHGTCSGSGSYNYLSQHTIQATANYGYHFTSWNDGDTTNPRTITLTQDTLFTALFAKNTYNLTGLSADTIRGSVSGSTTMEYLDSASIAATANYGYHFLYWNDGDTTNPRIITLTQDTVLTAYFAKNWYSVIGTSDNETMGYVTGSNTVEYLDNVSLSANSNYGYHFSSWNDGDTNNPRVVCITQDTTFTALFAKNQYTLTVQSNDETLGSVSNGGVFDYLDTVTIIASASEHYHFMQWNDGNTDNPREYVIVGDATLTAIFAIDTHSVSVTANDIARGMVEATGTEFSYGTPCTVTATAYTGYVFSRWSNGITANPYTFAVLEDTELMAIFEEEGTQWIDDVATTDNIRIFSKYDHILIDGLNGQDVTIYTIDGRVISSLPKATEHVAIPVTNTGVYIVKIGEHPAHKVVVIR